MSEVLHNIFWQTGAPSNHSSVPWGVRAIPFPSRVCKLVEFVFHPWINIQFHFFYFTKIIDLISISFPHASSKGIFDNVTIIYFLVKFLGKYVSSRNDIVWVKYFHNSWLPWQFLLLSVKAFSQRDEKFQSLIVNLCSQVPKSIENLK